MLYWFYVEIKVIWTIGDKLKKKELLKLQRYDSPLFAFRNFFRKWFIGCKIGEVNQ